MRFSLKEAALDLRSVVSVERVRVKSDQQQWRYLVERGRLEPAPEDGQAGMLARLGRLEQIAEFVLVLSEHEPAVRALDRRLENPPQPQADTGVNSSEI